MAEFWHSTGRSGRRGHGGADRRAAAGRVVRARTGPARGCSGSACVRDRSPVELVLRPALDAAGHSASDDGRRHGPGGRPELRRHLPPARRPGAGAGLGRWPHLREPAVLDGPRSGPAAVPRRPRSGLVHPRALRRTRGDPPAHSGDRPPGRGVEPRRRERSHCPGRGPRWWRPRRTPPLPARGR
jgi:hypothetical protein